MPSPLAMVSKENVQFVLTYIDCSSTTQILGLTECEKWRVDIRNNEQTVLEFSMFVAP